MKKGPWVFLREVRKCSLRNFYEAKFSNHGWGSQILPLDCDAPMIFAFFSIMFSIIKSTWRMEMHLRNTTRYILSTCATASHFSAVQKKPSLNLWKKNFWTDSRTSLRGTLEENSSVFFFLGCSIVLRGIVFIFDLHLDQYFFSSQYFSSGSRREFGLCPKWGSKK